MSPHGHPKGEWPRLAGKRAAQCLHFEGKRAAQCLDFEERRAAPGVLI